MNAISNNRLVNLYDRAVLLPSAVVSQPLVEVDQSDRPPDLVVTIGSPQTLCDYVFSIDDVVEISIAGKCVYVDPLPGLGELTLEHMVLDHAVPHGLSAQGDCLLHAASLMKNQQAVLLVGDSGVGKSTTAAYLASHGWELMSDDSVRLERQTEGVVAYGSYSGLRLHDGQITKQLLGQTILSASGLVADYSSKLRVQVGEPTAQVLAAKVTLSLILEPSGRELSVDRTPALTARSIGAAELCAAMAMQYLYPPTAAHDAIRRIEYMSQFQKGMGQYAVTIGQGETGLSDFAHWLNSVVDE